MCFGGGIIIVCNHFGSVVAEFDAYDAPTVSPTDTPTADVVEVVHARWEKIHDDPRVNKYRCTNCKAEKMRDNYCPNCGAKMDGERKE